MQIKTLKTKIRCKQPLEHVKLELDLGKKITHINHRNSVNENVEEEIRPLLRIWDSILKGLES